eukprot:CAMPEP_0171077612 /NCGR_PEP_ID=MMETSP0766_2-20121228/14135_1 /TAXON_ID=439317 /ORGANISM="Gambierdiscus australes, Strain CAWD 149" /LENGTH=204 /DNA_ID=CAMNT_0011534683 /DNA_START=1 /DNA_END=615 /DNA_ORIENTATION=+
MLGLDAAGKTTMLYKLRLGEVVTTIPTIGFNVETVEGKSRAGIVSFTVFDVGGRDKMRALWRYWYKQASAVIFMVDSNDRERMEDARTELERLLHEEDLAGKPLLVLANKQDLPNALPVDRVADELGLRAIGGTGLRSRLWSIQGTCAWEGNGLFEGLEWLSGAVAGTIAAPEELKEQRAASVADTESTADTEALQEDGGFVVA